MYKEGKGISFFSLILRLFRRILSGRTGKGPENWGPTNKTGMNIFFICPPPQDLDLGSRGGGGVGFLGGGGGKMVF